MLGLSPVVESSEVAYIFSIESTRAFDLLPSNKMRSSMVHSLIEAVGLFRGMKTYSPQPINDTGLLEKFHSKDYLSALLSKNSALDQETLDDFGLVDDSPLFPALPQYISYLGGSILATLKALEDGFRYVINWDGGRHHAQSSSASGYCYINDIVLLILELKNDYDRILYIDLDLHHGDGVESAFYFSDSVFTLSLHKFGAGFFPGSGDSESIGRGRGAGFCKNIPIDWKITGAQYVHLFGTNFGHTIASFDPDIIVCVCGADTLATDPHQGMNVGSNAYNQCIKIIVDTQIPTVFLGGGGYNHADSAKLWTRLTHTIVSASCPHLQELPSQVPEHEFWPQYANNEEMEVAERM